MGTPLPVQASRPSIHPQKYSCHFRPLPFIALSASGPAAVDAPPPSRWAEGCTAPLIPPGGGGKLLRHGSCSDGHLAWSAPGSTRRLADTIPHGFAPARTICRLLFAPAVPPTRTLPIHSPTDGEESPDNSSACGNLPFLTDAHPGPLKPVGFARSCFPALFRPALESSSRPEYRSAQGC